MDALPLAVDLDGTLIETDVLRESLWRAPWLLALAPVILALGGRPMLKRIAARAAPIDPARLPYRADFLAWLRAQREAGRTLVLATAAAEAPARAVAAHLGLFNAVHASRGRVNLKSARKADALAAAFPRGFAYAGDARADLKVWARAEAIVLVDCAPDVARAARALGKPVEAEFAPR